MINKIKNYLFLLFFFIFVYLVTNFYFSEKNLIYTSKIISTYKLISKDNIATLPLLKNDTKNILILKNDLEEFKKLRKKRSWENLITNNE